MNGPPQLPSLGHMNTLASWAEQLARALLQEPLPRRWAHSQGVAARARGLAPVLGADADLLEAAAWLHDIGYAPDLAVTGLLALDGARYLRDARLADAMLCRLIAHHSCAIIEAGERGLADVLSLEFEPAPYALSSVLTCCDMGLAKEPDRPRSPWRGCPARPDLSPSWHPGSCKARLWLTARPRFPIFPARSDRVPERERAVPAYG